MPITPVDPVRDLLGNARRQPAGLVVVRGGPVERDRAAVCG
jgi:hypothetical protein